MSGYRDPLYSAYGRYRTRRDLDKTLGELDGMLALALPELTNLRCVEVDRYRLPDLAFTQVFSASTYVSERARMDKDWSQIKGSIHRELLYDLAKGVIPTIFGNQVPRDVRTGNAGEVTFTGGLAYYLRNRPRLVFPTDFRLIYWRNRLHTFIPDIDPRQDGSTLICRMDIGLCPTDHLTR